MITLYTINLIVTALLVKNLVKLNNLRNGIDHTLNNNIDLLHGSNSNS